MDCVRPCHNGEWASGGACFIFLSNLRGFGVLFWSSLFLTPSPEFIPWQCASGSAGPLTVLRAPARQTPVRGTLSVSWQMWVGVLWARTDWLIGAAHGISRTFNEGPRPAVGRDRAACDNSISLGLAWGTADGELSGGGAGSHRQSGGSLL